MENNNAINSNDSDSDKMYENEYEDESEVDSSDEVQSNSSAACPMRYTQSPKLSRFGGPDNMATQYGCQDFNYSMPSRCELDSYRSDRYRPRKPVTINARRNGIAPSRDQAVRKWSESPPPNHQRFNVGTSADYNSLPGPSDQVYGNGGPHGMLPSFESTFIKQSYSPHSYTTSDTQPSDTKFCLSQESDNAERLCSDGYLRGFMYKYQQQIDEPDFISFAPISNENVQIPMPSSSHQYGQYESLKPLEENMFFSPETNINPPSLQDNTYQACFTSGVSADIISTLNFPTRPSTPTLMLPPGVSYDTTSCESAIDLHMDSAHLSNQCSLEVNPTENDPALSEQGMLEANNTVHPTLLPPPGGNYHDIKITRDSRCASGTTISEPTIYIHMNTARISNQYNIEINTRETDPALLEQLILEANNFANRIVVLPPGVNYDDITISNDRKCASDTTNSESAVDLHMDPTQLSNHLSSEVNPTENNPAPFEQLVLEANNAVNTSNNNDHAVTRLIENNPNLLLLRSRNVIVIAHPDFVTEQKNDLFSFGPSNQWIPINQVDSGKLPSFDNSR